MLEQDQLRQQISALLGQERQAADTYAELAASTQDAALKDQLNQLCRDKQRHVRLAERLLEILE